MYDPSSIRGELADFLIGATIGEDRRSTELRYGMEAGPICHLSICSDGPWKLSVSISCRTKYEHFVRNIFKVKMTLNITVAGLLVLVGETLCALYVSFPNYRDLLTFSASVMAGVATVFQQSFCSMSTELR